MVAVDGDVRCAVDDTCDLRSGTWMYTLIIIIIKLLLINHHVIDHIKINVRYRFVDRLLKGKGGCSLQRGGYMYHASLLDLSNEMDDSMCFWMHTALNEIAWDSME